MTTHTRNTAPSRPTWQKFLLILVLCVVVVALNGFYNVLATWRPILSAPAGEVIYAAGFDGFTDEWQLYQGRLSSQIANGTLLLKADELNSTPYSLATPQLADFDLTVQATAQAGPEDNGFGVIFRAQDSQNTCDMPMKLLCDLSEIDIVGVFLHLIFRPVSPVATGYYYFMISSDGYYALFKAETIANATQAHKVSTWIASDAITVGVEAKNILRVVARGDTFEFYVNGQRLSLCIADDPAAQSTYNYLTKECVGGKMLDQFVDDSYTVGQVGFIIQSPQTVDPNITDPVTVTFDNLIITSPQAMKESQA